MWLTIFLIWFVPAAGVTTYEAVTCEQSRVITVGECRVLGVAKGVAWPVVLVTKLSR